MELDEHDVFMSVDAAPGRHVFVSVSDTSTGMPPDVVSQIVDPFFTNKEVGQGTGLGLSTVAAILRSHGGFLNVYSEPGSGTAFRLYFPASLEQQGAQAPASSRSTPRGAGELILVGSDTPRAVPTRSSHFV